MCFNEYTVHSKLNVRSVHYMMVICCLWLHRVVVLSRDLCPAISLQFKWLLYIIKYPAASWTLYNFYIAANYFAQKSIDIDSMVFNGSSNSHWVPGCLVLLYDVAALGFLEYTKPTIDSLRMCCPYNPPAVHYITNLRFCLFWILNVNVNLNMILRCCCTRVWFRDSGIKNRQSHNYNYWLLLWAWESLVSRQLSCANQVDHVFSDMEHVLMGGPCESCLEECSISCNARHREERESCRVTRWSKRSCWPWARVQSWPWPQATRQVNHAITCQKLWVRLVPNTSCQLVPEVHSLPMAHESSWDEKQNSSSMLRQLGKCYKHLLSFDLVSPWPMAHGS